MRHRYRLDTEVCSHCGHGAFFDPPRLHEGREVSVVERVMLTMLYSEDREPRWWQRPGRIIFLVSTAAIGYLIWLSMAPSP